MTYLIRRRFLLVAFVGLLVTIPGTPRGAGAEPRVSGPARIMPLGDSITYGIGSSTDSSYRSDLWNRLVRDAGYSVDFVGSQRSGALPDTDHEGHSGWRIDEIAANIDGWLATYHPDVVTLHIGTNDMNQNFQVGTAPDRLGALIDRITTDLPAATVLVASIVPAMDAAIQARINQFNAALPGVVAARAQAGKRVRHVDLTSLGTADLADVLHPNDAGYAKMAALWYPAVARAIGDGRDLPLFASGFEAADVAQNWLDTTAAVLNVGGYPCCGLTKVEASPRQELAHGGVRAFMYSGSDDSATQSYAYARVFDVHIPVSAQTVLSYRVLPQQANGAYVAVDFLFTGGSSLRDSGAVDQFGVRVHPQMQGQGGHLALNQWNLVRSVVGVVAAGKTIDEIRIGYDQPAATGAFRGYVDDVALTDELTPYVDDNLALNRPVTGSVPCTAAESANKLTDAVVSGNSKWCSGAAVQSAQLDLGGSRGIKRIVVRHAGAGGEPVSYNTRDFTVAVSPDAATWTTVASVSGNADSVTAHPVAAVSARYVRLSVTAGTQTGEPVSRIYEIEVYGT